MLDKLNERLNRNKHWRRFIGLATICYILWFFYTLTGLWLS